ncbi:ribosomal protein L17 [Armillaria novae-zelandiae]|uniref:Ribosomal protein L17 n=1 Tax=Armillaria novae-zelandiae TaxID=153914 RepID=A0AA39P6W8_9AGAR|nr:ribosomal protein L17 [Armillaria novae-zelandiae]
MKHGVAFRKFSRTTSHRNLMLRNLVTSLFEHEQIKTTLPKAKDAARLAEKIITLGKKGNNVALTKASAFLLKQDPNS